MKTWDHPVLHTGKDEIVKYCVQDEEWQKFRKSLKGLPTEEKLDKLYDWRDDCQFNHGIVTRKCQVQIDNYVNALLRGGQLIRVDGVIIVQR